MACDGLISFTLLLATVFIFSAQGCLVEICRRKRAVVQERETLLRLQGCSGLSKPWVRQFSYCLRMSSAEVATRSKDWYRIAYRKCGDQCRQVRRGTNNASYVQRCTMCFKSQLVGETFFQEANVTIENIKGCIDSYVAASLNTELPQFTPETNNRGRIRLPRALPADNWWAVTVRLPCKPPLFQFWNANCVNSFADDVRARDFVLSQNRLVKGNIVFLATFSDTCRFDVKDVEIIWSESIPAFAVPQMSSFPSSMPPPAQQEGSIFFDQQAYAQYESFMSSGGRRKRAAADETKGDNGMIANVGIIWPCKIRSFQVSDENGKRHSVKTKGTRLLIEPDRMYSKEVLRKNGSLPMKMNFTMDYGYLSTGCIFGSNEPKVVVNPPSGWLDAKEEISCYTCGNAASERECMSKGKVVTCHPGEICQSEVRQVAPGKISISKSCKQATACENNWIQNNRPQCHPGHATSVCRCCCSESKCNKDAYHCT